MHSAPKVRSKAYKGLPMEGVIASWYARNTASQRPEFEADARRISERLEPDARVLEIAPGPGYLAIALAKLGPWRVSGVDISRAFVRIASENAIRAGVRVDFQHGDAAALPFTDESFDCVVCRAAFKNFADPQGALIEMYDVLKPGGEALIIDMSRDASDAAIDALVDEMKLGGLNALATRAIFKHSLRPRAYSKADFQQMAAATPFGSAFIEERSIGFYVWLRK